MFERMLLPLGEQIAAFDMPITRMRISLRMLQSTTLPAYKGAMLRGGFGYAFQRASCPRPCWGKSDSCVAGQLCPFRWVFETPHPPDSNYLHDLQDVPRPFIIEPPLDQKREYAAGDPLEFGLLLLGRGIDYLPYFLYSFEQLGQMGLGREQARFRMERVEALPPWQALGHAIYVDGRVQPNAPALPLYDAPNILKQAAQLPDDLHLLLRTPLRVKSRGNFIETLDLPAIVQSLCWRLTTLSAFHGNGAWQVDYRALVEQAAAVTVESPQVQWVDWERTSTRHAEPRRMKLGGIVGSATLRNVPVELRALLLLGSLVHIGKAVVFGHGALELRAVG